LQKRPINYVPTQDGQRCSGVAVTSRLLEIISLFCKRDLQKRRYSTKEAYILKESTNRSHPIFVFVFVYISVCVHVCVYMCACVYMLGVHVCVDVSNYYF